jgi:hypothetical protein
MSEPLIDWGKTVETATLPRWDDLPDIELYMDQVISLVGKYLSPILPQGEQILLTKAMVNNYVKLGLIPAPVKKKYSRIHLAFLITITLLKQVLTIPEIKTGIVYQGRISGIHEAYNIFCTILESALEVVGKQVQGIDTTDLFSKPIAPDYFIVTAASVSLATKLLAQKNIEVAEHLRVMTDKAICLNDI